MGAKAIILGSWDKHPAGIKRSLCNLVLGAGVLHLAPDWTKRAGGRGGGGRFGAGGGGALTQFMRKKHWKRSCIVPKARAQIPSVMEPKPHRIKTESRLITWRKERCTRGLLHF